VRYDLKKQGTKKYVPSPIDVRMRAPGRGITKSITFIRGGKKGIQPQSTFFKDFSEDV